MTVKYTGTPTNGGEYDIPCIDDLGRSFKLHVQIAAEASLKVVRYPNKMSYEIGDRLNPSGIVLRLIYTDGTYDEVSQLSEMTFDQDVLDTSGVIPVGVRYRSLSTTFSVSVTGSPTTHSVQYTGTPIEAGRFTLPCIDTMGRSFNLIVSVIDDGGDENNCYLIRYDGEYGDEYRLPLPNIQSIEESLYASLTEISTIVYGFDDNFVMDLGVTQKYNFIFRRVQPKDTKDPKTLPSTYENIEWEKSAEWSNGYWYAAFERFIDGWQNLNWGMIDRGGNDKERVWSGGFRLIFKAPREHLRENVKMYTDLYPEIDRMGFISGSISPKFSGSNLQYLDITIPFAVGSMIRSEQSAGRGIVEYHANIGENPNDPLYRFEHHIQTNMVDIAPSPPISWYTRAMGKVFSYWRSGSSEVYVGDRVSPGSALYAEWVKPDYIVGWSDSSGGNIVDLTEVRRHVDFKYIIVWAIGGGGAGGVDRISYKYCGGGGSGDLVLTTIQVPEDRTHLFVHVGEGGYSIVPIHPGSRVRYYDAEDSYVALAEPYDDRTSTFIPSTKLVTAKGGQYGRVGKGGAKGGKNGGDGGDPTSNSNGDGGVVPLLADRTFALTDKEGNVVELSQFGRYSVGAGGIGLSGTEAGMKGTQGAVALLFFGGSL